MLPVAPPGCRTAGMPTVTAGRPAGRSALVSSRPWRWARRSRWALRRRRGRLIGATRGAAWPTPCSGRRWPVTTTTPSAAASTPRAPPFAGHAGVDLAHPRRPALWRAPRRAAGSFVATENDTVYELAANTGAGLVVDPRGHARGAVQPAVRRHLAHGRHHRDPGHRRRPLGGLRRRRRGGRSPLLHITSSGSTSTPAPSSSTSPSTRRHRPGAQLQRASLALDDGNVIAGFGGNAGDCGNYHGLGGLGPRGRAAPTAFEVATRPATARAPCGWAGRRPRRRTGQRLGGHRQQRPHRSGDAYDDSDGVIELAPAMQLSTTSPLSTGTPTTERPRPRFDRPGPAAQRPGLRSGQVEDRVPARPVASGGDRRPGGAHQLLLLRRRWLRRPRRHPLRPL